jgi:RNA polymerase sigma-70 factor (ECF subfamily)
MMEHSSRPSERRGRESAVDPVSPSDGLIRRAQTGDHRAFTVLLRQSDGRMRRLASGLMGSRSATDDALQDAYLKAYRDLGDYHGDAAFATWLHTIVYRTCLDNLRQHNCRAEVDLDAVPEPSGGSNDAERIVDADAVDTALRNLPPDQAAVVILVDGDGCSYQEAAAVLGVREGTIASRLNRARRALRESLSVDLDERRRR